MRGWIARRKLHSFFQSCFGPGHPAKLKCNSARRVQAKPNSGRLGCALPFERTREIGLRLPVIRFRNPIARGLRGLESGRGFNVTAAIKVSNACRPAPRLAAFKRFALST